MKNKAVWLLLVVSLAVPVWGGCKKEKEIIPEKRLEIGFVVPEGNISAQSLQLKGQSSEVVGVLRKKYYNGVVLGNYEKEGQPAIAVATYTDPEDGKKYRYTHEPLEWSVIEGDPELVIFQPNPPAADCFIYPAGNRLGKVEIIAVAASGYTDTATGYIVPDMRSTNPAPVGLILDEEKWLSIPSHPGNGAITYNRNIADIIYETDKILFPYGATPLDVNFGTWLFFDEIDWDAIVEQEPAEYPYLHSWWYLIYDQKGRKIAVNMWSSSNRPLEYIAWHAQDRE